MGMPLRKLTLSEFVEWENAQPDRHEFWRGEVFATAGAEDRHVTVALNVAMALRQHLAGRLWVLHPFEAGEGLALASVDMRMSAATLFAEVAPPSA